MPTQPFQESIGLQLQLDEDPEAAVGQKRSANTGGRGEGSETAVVAACASTRGRGASVMTVMSIFMVVSFFSVFGVPRQIRNYAYRSRGSSRV